MTLLGSAALLATAVLAPAFAQSIPFTYGDNPKRAPIQSPGEMRIQQVVPLMEKKGYHRLPGQRFKNANGPAIPFNAPAGQHAQVAVPGEGCTDVTFDIQDASSGRRFAGQRVANANAQAIYFDFKRDTDVLINLRAASPLCVIYLVGFQK